MNLTTDDIFYCNRCGETYVWNEPGKEAVNRSCGNCKENQLFYRLRKKQTS